ncbi:MAG: dihydrodipicolinate synthase family protein [Clostridiales Family XIII bacterium]|nr:dihydrodipicolinate synthase family protein [Clostridiales Family XIII bacterium]
MINGVIIPAIVFFNADGGVDYEKCRAHMKWAVSKGVRGLFVTGTYGSGYLLTLEERVKIYETAYDLTKNVRNAFVIAHTGCIDTASAVFLTRRASEIGIKAASAISPLIYKYSEDDIKRYYMTLLESADIDLYAYNNPDLTGRALSVNIIEQLRAAGVKGLKDSSVDTELAKRFCETDSSDFQYIPGTVSKWIEFRRLGACAMIAGMCNYAPEPVVALYDASFKDTVEAHRIYDIISGLSPGLKFGNSLVSSHICLAARGFDSAGMRAPLHVDLERDKGKVRKAKELMDDAFARLRLS